MPRPGSATKARPSPHGSPPPAEPVVPHELAARAGITSRTLRHYGRIGLLAPSGVGAIRRASGLAAGRGAELDFGVAR
ncbi:MerR family DNA-binding transcriptional regulator [Streptosporangium minutum]|uniref:MerR family DNA-binding transcriptional regulator n=1 Tax=Streptosporangium minutum TaxID=569862 RepID=UPI00310163CC